MTTWSTNLPFIIMLSIFWTHMLIKFDKLEREARKQGFDKARELILVEIQCGPLNTLKNRIENLKEEK